MNKEMIQVWLPNENTYHTIKFKHASFKANSIYDDFVYGWYKGIYVKINRSNFVNK